LILATITLFVFITSSFVEVFSNALKNISFTSPRMHFLSSLAVLNVLPVFITAIDLPIEKREADYHDGAWGSQSCKSSKDPIAVSERNEES
jgi:hypothetical protein